MHLSKIDEVTFLPYTVHLWYNGNDRSPENFTILIPIDFNGVHNLK